MKFLLHVPMTTDQASQAPEKFTLSNDDGSLSVTLALASDATAGDDGNAMLTFTGLAEHHTYTLTCDSGNTTYTVFQDVDYENLGQVLDEESDSAPASDSTGAGDDDSAPPSDGMADLDPEDGNDGSAGDSSGGGGGGGGTDDSGGGGGDNGSGDSSSS